VQEWFEQNKIPEDLVEQISHQNKLIYAAGYRSGYYRGGLWGGIWALVLTLVWIWWRSA
jgi:hypothetical protein